MADLKITQLPAEASPALDDLLAIVDDVAGTPTTKKATIADVLALGAGGNITSTSAIAGPPSSPSSGDLWLPTNSFYIYRYSGSAWVPWGPIFPMTAPVDGDFSWVNQDGATVSAVNGGVTLSAPSEAAGENIMARVKTAPATPYTITAAFLFDAARVNFLQAGLLFRQSGDGKIAALNVTSQSTGADPSGSNLTSVKYDSPTSVNANYVSLAMSSRSLWWLQISDNGTNRILRWSSDGQTWQELHSVGRTDFLTADQVGFYVNVNGPRGVVMTLLSWKET